jgi:hypothetical protein
MRNRSAACALSVLFLANPGLAQTPAQATSPAAQLVPPPSWAFNDLACAPALVTESKDTKTPPPPYRVIGSQDPAMRDLLGPGDTLVISGGSNAGLESGQRYFVRRHVTSRGNARELPVTIHTVGWVQILGVDTMLATATVLHACDGILLDDYLEPFTPPMIAATPVPGTTPHYENMGQIMTGSEGLQTAGGSAQLMTIDRGTNAGVVVGQRFLVFRDKRIERIETTGRSKEFEAMDGRLPLVQVGEVLVIAVRANDATVQILGAKDAITTGDLIAPIR